jgi:hypothetical protein
MRVVVRVVKDLIAQKLPAAESESRHPNDRMASVTAVDSDEEILLQKVRSSSAVKSPSLPAASCQHPPALQTNQQSDEAAVKQTVSVPLPQQSAITTNNKFIAQTRIMSDNRSGDRMATSFCHSDSTEFDMPFGIDDDDLVNYQPPIIYSSRSSSAKYLNNRSSSKSFDLEAFEEEDLNLNESEIDDSILHTAW